MKTKKQKHLIEGGKTLLILLLALTALFLVRESTLFDGFGIFPNSKKAEITVVEPGLVEGTKISVQPARLAVQNTQGRFGVQYNQQTTDHLFQTKLGILLREALNTARESRPATKAQWQSVIRGKHAWIYYDFLNNLPLEGLPLWLGSEGENPVLFGSARSFLLAVEGEGFGLYYYDEAAENYYCCNLTEGSGERFRTAINDFVPNGAVFAFENPEAYGKLDDNVMILPTVPRMTVYEVSNPLAQMDTLELDEILRALAFNPSAVSSYETAAGTAITEGMDTLRILKDGTVVFHSQGSDQARYPVSQDDPVALVENLQERFVKLMGDRCGEATPYLLDVTTEEEGSTLVSFGYRLNGAPVKIFGEGYAAQVSIQNGAVQDFSVHLRQYRRTEEEALILPEKQAAAAVKAMEGDRPELLLAYIDSGEETHITVKWISQ